MGRYLAKRLLWAIPTILAAGLAAFVLMRVLPNNPALVRFGQHAVPSQVAEEMRRQGWDQPIYVQAGGFLQRLARGDLGDSFLTGQPIAEDLPKKFAATLELSLAACLIAIPLGLLLGVAGAVYRDRWPDHLARIVALVGVSVPVFFVGLLLLATFRNFPTGRQLPLGVDFPRLTNFVLCESLLRVRFDVSLHALRHLFLPALALSTIPLAYVARIARGSMLEVLSADYLRTARAKGAGALRVLFVHALPNASGPILNVAGVQLGALLSGAVLTETVFSWPGLGRWMVDAVQQSDYNVVQAGVLLLAGVYVLLNLTVDLFAAWLDPRLRDQF